MTLFPNDYKYKLKDSTLMLSQVQPSSSTITPAEENVLSEQVVGFNKIRKSNTEHLRDTDIYLSKLSDQKEI